jgi:hypothetical protein
MSLTKEECEKAYSDIKTANDYPASKYNDTRVIDFALNTFEQLIKEHFELLDVLKDCGWGELTPEGLRVVIEASQYNAKKLNELRSNPPLKFEELKTDMWVWDNCWCEWFEISEVYQETKEFDILIHQNAINKKRYETIKFEENRFFRKQVEE